MEKSYLVTGEVKTNLGRDKFKKEVDAISKERAVDKALCMIGGCHKVKRRQIKIVSVEELQGKPQ
jgi:ribosomal protein L20A (L18A)